jgi:hypothetical protein
MIDWNWFGRYGPNDLTVDEVVISWDTAMKATELSDYSAGTVWGVSGGTPTRALNTCIARADSSANCQPPGVGSCQPRHLDWPPGRRPPFHF